MDELASILRPKYSMNFLHSIMLTVKMGSAFFLFSATILEVIKTDPEVIGSSCKMCDMLALLYQLYCSNKFCPCRYFRKVLHVPFKLNGIHNIMKTFLFRLMLEGGRKYTILD